MTPRVFVTRALPGNAIERLGEEAAVEVWPGELPPSPAQLLRRSAAATGLICLLTDSIGEEFIAASPRLRVVSNVATGYDNIDIDAATKRGIAVTNTPGVLDETTADFAFALLMAVARRVVEADRFVREGNWKTWDPGLLLGIDVHGATLGLVGMGKIGSAVARRAGGFGMRVLYHARNRQLDVESECGARHSDLNGLLAEADFVSIHVPLTEETRGMIGGRALALMKSTSILINTSRGGVVDEAALVAALSSGRIAGAGLDVAESEPVAPGHPLLALPNVVFTPHVASASLATRSRMAIMAVDSCLAALRGEKPANCLNPEIYATGDVPA